MLGDHYYRVRGGGGGKNLKREQRFPESQIKWYLPSKRMSSNQYFSGLTVTNSMLLDTLYMHGTGYLK